MCRIDLMQTSNQHSGFYDFSKLIKFYEKVRHFLPTSS